jgi:regulation of enolase protein 1 (concanavalin A-like superfamily)
VTIGVPANVASDLDGDGNAASASLQVTSNRLPTIVQPATQAGKTGDIVSFQISAVDPEGAALTFSATDLPSGLSINAATGLVSGVISIAAAPFSNVVVTVSDGVWSVNAAFTWNVTIGTALPAPWAGNDIGSPGLVGSAEYSAGMYTVEGGGADIWNSSDQFYFASRQFTGNGEIIARITSQSNTDPWAKAGVMFRETSQANSRHTMMVLTPGNGTAFQYRASTGGVSATAAGSSAAAPNNWVRLVRNGDLISGYRSTDGVNWTQVGSANIPMASVISVGLAVTSRNNGVLSTATFDNVQVKPSTLPAPWIGLDIGTPTLTEIDRYTTGAYRVYGGGSDIYSTSDSFHFTYQPLIGDGRITARVSSQTNTNAWAKAGVMFRDGLQANAKNAALFLTPSNGFAWQRRTAVGGATTRSAASSYTASNNWIRIIRKGNNFTAYRSSNGTSWSKISSVNITMAATVYVGFAVTACDNTKISEGVFDNVQVIDKP